MIQNHSYSSYGNVNRITANIVVLMYILLSVMFLDHNQASAWVEEDAVWHYRVSNISDGGFIRMRYDRDTLMAGQQAQILESREYMFVSDQHEVITLLDSKDLPPSYVYANDDTVFYYLNGDFQMLYDFSAQKGDRWDLGVDSNALYCGKSMVEVDSAGTIEINGETRRWVWVTSDSNSSVILHGKIIEGIGIVGNGFLFPETRDCMPDIVWEWPYYQFSCFESASFPLYNVTARDCEYLMTLNLDNVLLPDVTAKAYPNPAGNFIAIYTNEYDRLPANIRVFTIDGKVMEEVRLTENGEEINISHLPGGTYILSIHYSGGKREMVRMIKN